MDYITLYNQMVVDATVQAKAAVIAQQIRAEKRYKLVERDTGVSADLIGVLHYLESGSNFATHLHNGDSLRRRTVNVPKGRPTRGKPPYNWVDSAIDAVTYDDLTTSALKSDQCQAAIFYNGRGYERYNIVSPYGFAGSNLYTKGKYVRDGIFSHSTISKQIGACVILKELEKLDAPNIQQKEPSLTLPANVVAIGTPKPKSPGVVFIQPDPKTKISQYFRVGEFNKEGTRKFVNQDHFDACKRLANYLDGVREFYDSPITITSGIRTPEANRAAGGAPNSYHVTTRGSCAADIKVKGVSNRQVFKDYNGTHQGGLGLYSSANGTTHFDLGEVYSRDVNGKIKITIVNRRWDWTLKSEAEADRDLQESINALLNMIP